MRLDQFIEQNATNHYKMLTIVDNNQQYDSVVKELVTKGWASYDVEQAVLNIIETIPQDKIKIRISNKIKEWVVSLPDKVIFYNTSILYSPELGRLNPVGAFKYRSREKEIIVFVKGQLSGNRLQYSEYGKDDFTQVDVSELITVRMEDING